MNLIKAYELREQLNSKMCGQLLQGLREELTQYLRAVENYSPEQMVKYGHPYIVMLETKISQVESIIAEKFTN